MTHRFARRALAATLCLASLPACADAQDDAIRAQCPSAQAWMDRMAAAHAKKTPPPKGALDPAFRDELHAHHDTDVAARRAWIEAQGAKPQTEHMLAIDRDNLAWMKRRFAKGFPSAAQVGRNGVEEAFLLVQHADGDHAFQSSMLEPIMAAAKRGELPQGDVAMLIDRVLRAEGKPQRYGTQYQSNTPGDLSAMKLQPTEDPAHLEARRASMDLMPSDDYACMLKVVYAGSSQAPAH
ncbi:hypothetical protein L2Y94_21185 [Luteibacter aegosomatis]|uniref:DUF6624 domain-containing protein n=1 Tax=Luteibacter aegosomatis TaxID=2911537 RepID=UPI001FF7EF56|nr:DUF6624 domain-containing protein [Luteibacter aegosomatis]UPG85772.1 hypothetical protein L2Y94_21185 [Luteibacter aegosomatis]